MADNRKYYYLKLKESYFDDDSIVLLESMQDGEPRKDCVKEDKRHPFSQELEQEKT